MKTILLSLLILISFINCQKNTPKNIIQQPGEQLLQLARINGHFGWDVFKKSCELHENENVLLSPLSIHIALAMAANGADRETKSELLQVLHSNHYPLEQMNKNFKELLDLLSTRSGHPRLTIPNALFYDPNRIKVSTNFNDILSNYFSAQINPADFAQTHTLNTINQWVKNSTKGKIDQIIEEIKPEDLAFLMSALHFKSDWSRGFDPNLTAPLAFQNADRVIPNVPFMQADREIHTAFQHNLMMADLPFKDSTYSLSLIMHTDPNTHTSSWLKQTTFEQIQSLWKDLQYDRALILLPKFKIKYKEQLIPNLQSLGIHKAFDPFAANFNPMGQSLVGPNIYISNLLHKAVLEIDEKGAEGAAVTSITFAATSLPQVLQFDKPFVVLLRHIPSNTLIFAGRVHDPTE